VSASSVALRKRKHTRKKNNSLSFFELFDDSLEEPEAKQFTEDRSTQFEKRCSRK